MNTLVFSPHTATRIRPKVEKGDANETSYDYGITATQKKNIKGLYQSRPGDITLNLRGEDVPLIGIFYTREKDFQEHDQLIVVSGDFAGTYLVLGTEIKHMVHGGFSHVQISLARNVIP